MTLIKKRLFSIVGILFMLVAIAACGSPAAEDPVAEEPAAEEAVEEEAEEAEEMDDAEEEADAEEEMEEAAADDDGVEPIFLFGPAELSGGGATVGNNWKDGATIAIEEINASGGILGRPIEIEWADTQSDPATSKAVIARGLEQDPYAIVGPLYSGSIIVNMVEAERAGVPQIVGGEGAALTQQGNPYIFRTSFGQSTSMPKIAAHLEASGITSVDVVWVNNEFGKGGRDAIVAELEARGIEVVNDISTEEQQADFAPEALTAVSSDADALFAYMNEEESARLLAELQSQGYDKPIYGETVLISQAVIDLAGESAEGVQGHVGLTTSAPLPLVEEFGAKFEEAYGRVSDHNGMKGYIAVYVLKEMTERIGELDQQALADALHCTSITTEDEPGVLMDIVYDENGDVDRESFLVEVQDGQQVVTEVLPRLGGTCGEPEGADDAAAVASDEVEPIFLFGPAELSGGGATVGNNWKDGATIAIEEINASGGILGRPIEIEWADTQSDPATSKAVIARGLEQDPYAIVGPLYSGSIIVNMVEAERAGVPQIVGGEGAALTQQGNPYIFRTSFGQSTSMPKIAAHLEASGITSVDVVWVNNEFGKGGRDAIVAELESRGIEVVNDISTEEQQADFAPEALTAVSSDADALFAYMNEEESARLLAELQSQGYEKPIFGETVLISQAVIDLAGDAAEGVQGHVGLTTSAPLPLVEEFGAKFEEAYDRISDHNGMKGYIAVYVLKEMTERIGEFDQQALADALHCTSITTEDEPGVLMDIVYDENGDVDRESFLVEVQDGQQVVTEVLPRLGGTCGEPESADAAASAEGEPIFLFGPAELSGGGATVGNNWKDGATIAIEEINATGGILGRPIEIEWADTQSDPATSKAVIARGLEQDPYAIVGPLYSGSIIVNMVEAERAGVPQIVGGEGAALTQQGNPYIFRTSFGQSTSMPKIAAHLEASGITSVDVVWVNNEFGKGGRDAIVAELEARGIEVVNDISTEEQQADFAPEALTAVSSGADALFAYMNEEESARLLAELQSQGYEKPIFGETVLISQAVIDLAGDAAEGAQGHVGLTVSAPLPLVEEFGAKFEAAYGRISDHNGMKGYIAVYVLKEMTERLGEFDQQALADALHCTTITTEDEPGVLMDIVYDENGDVDRESFLVEVQDGQQVVTEVLPRLGGTCGEQ